MIIIFFILIPACHNKFTLTTKYLVDKIVVPGVKPPDLAGKTANSTLKNTNKHLAQVINSEQLMKFVLKNTKQEHKNNPGKVASFLFGAKIIKSNLNGHKIEALLYLPEKTNGQAWDF